MHMSPRIAKRVQQMRLEYKAQQAVAEVSNLRLQLWAAQCRFDIAVERAAERHSRLAKYAAKIILDDLPVMENCQQL